jgi:hypothetical protein
MTLGCRLLRSLFLGSGGLEIGRIEVIFPGNPDQCEQGITPSIG